MFTDRTWRNAVAPIVVRSVIKICTTLWIVHHGIPACFQVYRLHRLGTSRSTAKSITAVKANFTGRCRIAVPAANLIPDDTRRTSVAGRLCFGKYRCYFAGRRFRGSAHLCAQDLDGARLTAVQFQTLILWTSECVTRLFWDTQCHRWRPCVPRTPLFFFMEVGHSRSRFSNQDPVVGESERAERCAEGRDWGLRVPNLATATSASLRSLEQECL